MTIARINKASDATWTRSWEVADAAELATLLATFSSIGGPKRGDIIVQLDEGLIFLLVNANLTVQVNNLATLQGTNTFTGANAFNNFALELGEGQIQFPTPQVPSAIATVLDDYREGTWTPVVTFGGGSTGITYGVQVGSHVKIGQLVFASFRIDLTNKGSSTGAAQIEGLPFASSAIANVFGVMAGSGSYANFAGLTGALTGAVNNNSTTAALQQSGATGVANLDDTNFTNTTVLISGYLYRAAD